MLNEARARRLRYAVKNISATASASHFTAARSEKNWSTASKKSDTPAIGTTVLTIRALPTAAGSLAATPLGPANDAAPGPGRRPARAPGGPARPGSRRPAGRQPG